MSKVFWERFGTRRGAYNGRQENERKVRVREKGRGEESCALSFSDSRIRPCDDRLNAEDGDERRRDSVARGPKVKVPIRLYRPSASDRETRRPCNLWRTPPWSAHRHDSRPSCRRSPVSGGRACRSGRYSLATVRPCWILPADTSSLKLRLNFVGYVALHYIARRIFNVA